MSRQSGPVLRTVLAILLLGTTAALARPIGDFGRPAPSTLHDDILPAMGETRARLGKEPVSGFNLTDQEVEMHDRIWRFLVAPHAHDWSFDFAAEMQRTRLTRARDHKFGPERYYRWLSRTEFRSSRVRYAAVADHVHADLDTLPATFRSICAVLEVDRQRAITSREFGGLEAADVAARRAENEAAIGWFVRAAAYRHESYGYALDHLLVETPHEEAVEVDRLLSLLAVEVGRAERGEFCIDFGVGQPNGDGKIPSRLLMHAPGEGGYRK